MTASARRYISVRSREGELLPLVANEAQQRFETRHGRQNIVLKARQMGITTWVSARFFLHTIANPGTLTLQVAHTRSAAEGIFRTVQRMWENLPAEWRNGPLKRSRANVGQMVFAKIDSEFRVASACDIGVGRGMSVQNLHCSEVSRWPGDATETLAGLRAALAPHGELVLESTPNGIGGPFYQEWNAGIDDPAGEGLVRHFLPWWIEPTYVSTPVALEEMTEDERGLVEKQGLRPEQIGFRRGLEQTYTVLRSQEFAEDPETCFLASGQCCFELEAIETRMKHLDEPYKVRRNGALHIWWPALANRDYLLAVDTAGGGRRGDFAAIQIVDRDTGAQCAELQQRLRPRELAAVAAKLARKYNHALIVVERNNHGAGVLAYLETGEKYTRVYKQRGQEGWLTTASSKREIVARLGALLVTEPERFASRRLLAECRTFVTGEDGEMGAVSGAHDDLVMSMAIAQEVRVETMGRRRRALHSG